MTHNLESYRIFISAPGALEPDREACYEVVAQINQETAMPSQLLLISVGMRDNAEIASKYSLISANLRSSSYLIQLFQDDWGAHQLFRQLFLEAVDARRDPQQPMREIVVCLKDAPPESTSVMLALRKELMDRTDLELLTYSSNEELCQQLKEVCFNWAMQRIAERGE